MILLHPPLLFRDSNIDLLASTTKSAIRPYGKRLSFPPDYFSNSRPADATTSSSTARARGSSGVRDKQEETQTQTQTQGHTQGQGHVRCVKQFHPLTGTLLHVYPSLKAAGKAMRAQWTQDLSKCCLGFSKTSAEFVWRYSARTMTGSFPDC